MRNFSCERNYVFTPPLPHIDCKPTKLDATWAHTRHIMSWLWYVQFTPFRNQSAETFKCLHVRYQDWLCRTAMFLFWQFFFLKIISIYVITTVVPWASTLNAKKTHFLHFFYQFIFIKSFSLRTDSNTGAQRFCFLLNLTCYNKINKINKIIELNKPHK